MKPLINLLFAITNTDRIGNWNRALQFRKGEWGRERTRSSKPQTQNSFPPSNLNYNCDKLSPVTLKKQGEMVKLARTTQNKSSLTVRIYLYNNTIHLINTHTNHVTPFQINVCHNHLLLSLLGGKGYKVLHKLIFIYLLHMGRESWELSLCPQGEMCRVHWSESMHARTHFINPHYAISYKK